MPVPLRMLLLPSSVALWLGLIVAVASNLTV
jgi:hypothetical protein